MSDALRRPFGERSLLRQHIVRLAAGGRVPPPLCLGDRALGIVDRALSIAQEEVGARQQEIVIGGQAGVVQAVQ
jgi:hypothetical protein